MVLPEVLVPCPSRNDTRVPFDTRSHEGCTLDFLPSWAVALLIVAVVGAVVFVAVGEWLRSKRDRQGDDEGPSKR